MNNENRKLIVMLGTRFDTMGGISSVVNVYRAAGLFDRWPIRYMATHCDGGASAKLAIMCRALAAYFRLLLVSRIQLVHIHVSSRASFWRKGLFAIPAMLVRVPVVLHLHGSEFATFYEKECGPLRKWIVRTVFNHAARVIVLSSSWKAWVEGISNNRAILCVYNPVVVPEESAQLNMDAPKNLLFLGRLGKRKGTYDLLDAFAMARPNIGRCLLQLGGDGDIEQIRQLALSRNLMDDVELLGWVGGERKQQLLLHATVYVLPSYNEGLPMSILEAMSFGLPIVSTTIGGIPEAVTDGKEGFLIEPGDRSALADRLGRLICDPELARSMGAAARRKVESTFSADVLLPQVERIWVDLGGCSR